MTVKSSNNTRTINVKRNITYGLLYKMVTLLLPFVTRTVLLYLLGTSSVGISTLFTSILSFLSLAELGFGSAIVYLMYKPVAENDEEKICALLAYYKRLYRIIGCIVLAIGLLLIPFLPLLTKGEAPDGINTVFLYLIYLAQTVISYFAAGYRQSLLIAHQRSDIRDKIAIFVTILVRILEITVICVTKNLYLYAIVALIGTIVTNLLTAIVTRKLYPNIYCKGTISEIEKKAIGKKISGLLGTKLNSIIVHQADTIVISSFLGLTMVAQYGNYYYILNTVSGFIMILFTSMTASIGNKVTTDTPNNVRNLFAKISIINEWIVGWCSICLLCLYQPFMKLWVGESLMLPFSTVILLALYLYFFQIQRTILTFKDACGLWYEDRYRPYVSMVFNVVTNILLVTKIGINGVVISSITAYLISLPWCNHVVFKYYFKENPQTNLIQILRYSVWISVFAVITYMLCSLCTEGILGLIERFLICCVVPNIMLVVLFRKSVVVHDLINGITKYVRK